MKPRDFANLFATVATKHRSSFMRMSGSSTDIYTKWLEKTIAPEMAHQANMTLHLESYPAQIDYVLSQDAVWPHRLDIAIEHEKAGKSAKQELAKLALVNSGLAVLITYINKINEEKFLPHFRNLISHLGMLASFGKERGFLLILGQHDPWKPVAHVEDVAWRFFSLEGGEWKHLEILPRPQVSSNGLLMSGEGECPNSGQQRPRLNYMDLLECPQCHTLYANIDGVVATLMPFLGQGEFRESNKASLSLAGTVFAKSKDGGVLPDMNALFTSREELARYVATLKKT